MILPRLALLSVAALLLSVPAEAGKLTGRLLSEGAPVAGAVVSAMPHESPVDEARREARRVEPPKALATTTTGPDGAFALTLPTTGKATWFRARFEAKGFILVELSGAFEAGEAEDVGDLALTKGGPLAGRVVGPGSAPVGAARVILTPRLLPGGSSDLAPVPRVATTGPDGTFRFDGAGTGANELVIEAAGLATQRVEAPTGGALRSAVALLPAATLSGSVKRGDGKPAPGAVVRYEAGELATRWVETAPDASFRLGDLPSRKGRVVVDAGEEGWAEVAVVAPGPSAKPVVLTLALPATLEGKTVNAESLRPVPRVRLTVRAGDATYVGRSGPDGKYRIRGLRPGEVDVKADEPRHVPWTREGVRVVRGEAKTLDVPLTLGATLTGRVVDEAGRSVADAKGMVSRNVGGFASLLAGRRGGKPAFRSRADGGFTATRLAPGENQNVAVAHPEHERSVLGGVALTPGGTKAGLLFTLRRGLVLSGNVRDADGKPIPGAEVTLSQSRTLRSSRGGRVTMSGLGGAVADLPRGKSGADGRFELRGVAEGSYTVRVKAPGFSTETVDPVKVARDDAPAPLDVVLWPGASVAGTVRRRTGEGAEGLFVFARPQGGSPGPGGTLENPPTGPDGAFLLEGLRAGATYDLQVMGGSPGPGPIQKGVVAPAENVEIVVMGTGRIEGNAVDAKTGHPLTSFDVAFQPDRGGGGGMVFRFAGRAGGRSGGMGEQVRVEAEDGRFVLEEVPAGKWSVVVEAKGYQPARAGGVVVEEATTTDGVEVRVPPGSLLKGRVTDARTGRPVVEANVSASGTAGGGGGLPPGLQSRDGAGLLTDADGRFEVDGLAPGKVMLRVDHADYEDRTETVELKEGGATVEVALSRGGALGGTVLSATRQPAAGAEVTLQLAGEGGFGRGSFGGASQSAVTDAAGRFRFDHLSAGRYSAAAQLSGQASEPQSSILTAGESKEDLVLVLAGGATLRGVVSGLPEARRAGVMISANGPRQFNASARTGADGRFELTGLPVGATTLRATAGDFLSGGTRSASQSVTIAEGQLDAEAEVAFEGDSVLSGTVTRGGRPVTGAMVFAGPRRGGANASTRTDDSGTYRMEGLENGDYSVSVQPAPGAGGRSVSTTVAVAGDTTQDFEVPTASLSGVVVAAATKQPLEGVRVGATLQGGAPADGGRRFGGTSTDTNGRWFLDDVEPGTWDLVFRREGYLEETRNAVASETGGDGGTVELTRGEGLELRVRDGIYQIPLRGVSVRVKDGAGSIVMSTFVSLDGDGKGEVPSLKPGRYTLVVDSSGYAVQRYEGVVVPAAPLPVALTPGGAVEIRSGEASRGKGNATLRNALGQPHPLRAFGEEGRVSLPASGSSTLSNLAPGSYTLAVEGVAPKGFTVTEGGRTVVDLP